jgi:type I restriction enzyme S subunit
VSIVLKPYPEYRESGLPWFGKIPAHWHILRTGRVFREVVDTGHPDLDLLSIDRFRGVIRQTETGRKARAPEDRSAYKRARRGDLAYNLMNAFMGSIGVSPMDGILSPAYAVGRPLRPMNPWYYHYLYRTPIYTSQFDRCSYGIMYERNRLYFDRFRTIPVPCPPPDEQTSMITFIRNAEWAVRQLIRKKRQMLELLNEQKQAIIQRAVTRGLDPSVGLRPSGIDWLGDVPHHWQLRRLKYLVRNVNDQVDKQQQEESYLALEHVESWTGRARAPGGMVSFDSQVKRFAAGDILFGKLRPYLAKVTRPTFRGVCVGEFLVLRPIQSEMTPALIEQKLRSAGVINIVNSSTFGAKMPRADWSFIGNLAISFPPAADEQKAVLGWVRKQTACVDIGMERAAQEIGLIREYRTRLIADVVTGKLDVRDVVLPTEDESLEAVLFNEEPAEEAPEDSEEFQAREEVADADE